MNKIILFCIWAISTLTTLPTYGQEIYKCDTLKSYWTFEKNNTFLAVKIEGNVKTTQRKNVISVYNYVLQNIILDKAKFVKEGEDNTDLKIMMRYATSEAEYLSGQFKTKINIKMSKAPISEDKSVLIWYFEMPSNMNNEVKLQIFANIIIGDKIFGLASSQFADQKFENVRDFLMDVISTVKKLKKKKEFSTLCRK